MACRTRKRLLLLIATVVCLQTEAAKTQTKERPYALELRIECPRQNILVGDEIPIAFTITNRDTEPFSYLDRSGDRSGRMDEYELRARNQDGTSVPDPREDGLRVGAGGLGAGTGQIHAGGSFRKTIVLNLWALIKEPGRYRITGIYRYDVPNKEIRPLKGSAFTKVIRVTSSPIEIEVKPRSHRDMGEYIGELAARLNALGNSKSQEARDERVRILARMSYTCDERMIPVMLDSLKGDNQRDDRGNFQAFQAFCCFLPHTDNVRKAVLNAARTRGLNIEMTIILEHLNCAESDLAEIIRLSLAAKDPNIVTAAVVTAGEHPSDDYMPRLIAIALGTETGTSDQRRAAISAIAYHRTDEGVAALKTLLNDPDEAIRKRTAEAIREAYRSRLVYPEKVDDEYTAALVSIATDRRHPRHIPAVYEIASTRTPEGVKAVKMLLADPNAQVPMSELDLGVRTIRDLLRDNDPDVRAYAQDAVKGAYWEYRGRALRPDDFPPEFREDPEARKKRLLQWLKAE